ncbi:MAG: type II secretion system protein [Gemmatimonadaceae bacterium]
MTLLESVIALVILGLASVGFLELFQSTNRNTRDAQEWVTAVAYAEEGIEAAKAGQSALNQSAASPAPRGFARRVEVKAWRGGMTDVVVTVTLRDGAEFVIHRLVAAQ